MGLQEIIGYPRGANLTIMNVFYQRPAKNEATGRFDRDYAIIVFKIMILVKKNLECIMNQNILGIF